MAVTDTTNSIRYNGNGATVAFTFPFKVFVNTDLKIYNISAAGVVTLLALTTDYTVVINTTTEGGTVTLVVATASGAEVLILRDLPNTQGNRFPREGNFPESSVEDALDAAVMRDIEIETVIKRALKFATTSEQVDVVVPEPEANKVLGYDADGVLVNLTPGTEALFVKATGAELITGTNDSKFATALGIAALIADFLTAVKTFTNKSVTRRVITTTDDATAVIDVAVTDIYQLTAIANATVFSFTGTPTDGQPFIIRYKDAGVSKALTWTGVTAIGVTLPTATTAGKWGYVGIVYNSTVSQYQAIAVSTEA